MRLALPVVYFGLERRAVLLQIEQPFNQLYPFGGKRIYKLRKFTLRQGYALAEVFLVYAYYLGYFVGDRLYVIGNCDRLAVAVFVQHGLVGAALALNAALHKVALACAFGLNIECKAYFKLVALIVYLVKLVRVALYIAVQRKVDGVEYGALSAAGFAEDAEYAAF